MLHDRGGLGALRAPRLLTPPQNPRKASSQPGEDGDAQCLGSMRQRGASWASEPLIFNGTSIMRVPLFPGLPCFLLLPPSFSHSSIPHIEFIPCHLCPKHSAKSQAENRRRKTNLGLVLMECIAPTEIQSHCLSVLWWRSPGRAAR